MADDETRRESAAFGKALVMLWLVLDPDPVRWIANRWRPDAARITRRGVRAALTSARLRALARHMEALAEHADARGGFAVAGRPTESDDSVRGDAAECRTVGRQSDTSEAGGGQQRGNPESPTVRQSDTDSPTVTDGGGDHLTRQAVR